MKRVLKRVQSSESRHSSKQVSSSWAAGQWWPNHQNTFSKVPTEIPDQQSKSRPSLWRSWQTDKLVQCLLPLHGSNHAHLRICCQRFWCKSLFLHWVAGKMRNHDPLLSFRHRLPRPKPRISWRARKSTRLQRLTTTPFLFKV